MRKNRLKQEMDRARFLISLFFILGVMTGCEKEQNAASHGGMVINVVAFESVEDTIKEEISLIGNIDANEFVEIKNEIDGIVEHIGFSEGKKVQKGEILFRINERKLRASLDQAQANLKLSQASADRYEALISSRAVSQQEYDQAKAALEADKAHVALAQAQLSDATLAAPFDGIMGARWVSEGQFIESGTRLSTIMNQNPMKAQFHIPERFLSRVKEDQIIEVSVAAYPDQTFQGQVYFIGPDIDPLTRTALIKATLPNPEGSLRRGMFANLKLIVQVKQNAVLVPETALILKGEKIFLFTIDEENKVHEQSVKTGLRTNGKVEITSGLVPGERVVIEGHQKLHEGADVAVTFQGKVPIL